MHTGQILRTGTLAAADQAMSGRACRFNVDGIRLVFDGAVFGLAREIYGRKTYFSAPGFAIRATDTVVDLGAHQGVFAVWAAKMAGRVVAVEAQGRLVELLRQNAQLNSCSDKLEVVFGFVGGRRGLLADRARAASNADYMGKPPSLKIQEVLSDQHLERINFLKIDIEGSEFDLFSDGTDWVRLVDRIAMEVHPLFGNPTTIAETLAGNGFRVWLFSSRQDQVQAIKGAASGYLFAERRLGDEAAVCAHTDTAQCS
jgi:FkbM family methyltransferase